MQKEEQRYREKTCLMEGMTSIRALIKAAESDGVCRIRKVLYNPKSVEKKAKEIAWLSRCGEKYGFLLFPVPGDEIDRLTTGNSHGGIVAYAEPRTLPHLTDDFVVNDGFYVMIEGIEDPYNFGYCIRSLYAFGVSGIVLPQRNWMSAEGIVARASAGASILTPACISDAREAAVAFKNRGFSVVCTAKDAESSLQQTSLFGPVFLIIGGEKRGISASLRSLADREIRIDYTRDFSASLSAASAATILAYEIAKQRQNR